MNAILPIRPDTPYDAQAIWLAVIERAFLDARWRQKPINRDRSGDYAEANARSNLTSLTVTRDTAQEWLLGNSRGFRTICDCAGVDPDWVRRVAMAEAAEWDRRTARELCRALV
jgi:hypothetical protein